MPMIVYGTGSNRVAICRIAASLLPDAENTFAGMNRCDKKRPYTCLKSMLVSYVIA